MKKSAVTLVGTLIVAGSAMLCAQDPAKVDPTHYKAIIDNAANIRSRSTRASVVKLVKTM